MDRSAANKATSSDDSPTPGYILTELANCTLANYDACKQLEDFLVSKLAKNDHNVKYKALVCIRHICRHGRVEFKRDMARHVEPIKECLRESIPPICISFFYL
jgi:hypothetical protein